MLDRERYYLEELKLYYNTYRGIGTPTIIEKYVQYKDNGGRVVHDKKHEFNGFIDAVKGLQVLVAVWKRRLE